MQPLGGGVAAGGAAPRPCPPASVGWRQGCALRARRPARLPASRSSPADGPSGNDGPSGRGSSDVVRPSAKAAAPPSLPGVDLGTTAGQAAGAGSSSASYSEFYKALNAVKSHKQQQQQPAAVASGSGLANPSRTGSDATLEPGAPSGSDHSSQPPPPPPQQQLSAQPPSPPQQQLSAQQQQQQQQQQALHAAASARQAAAAAAAAGVEDAILKAQAALAAAEDSLSSIHTLPSARPPSKWAWLLQLLRSGVAAAAAGAFIVASHAFGLGWQWAGATLGALALSARAYQRRTVTPAGAVVAGAAVLATLGCSLRFGLAMLAYSYSSGKLRKLREARQDTADVQGLARPPAEVPRRDWPEIVCCAGVPTILAIAFGAMAGCLDVPLGSLPTVETWRADVISLLQGGVLGWYACVCGDAWSTELGALSADQPRLATSLQPVRRGTHGGITLLGLSGAAAGGLLVGLVFYSAAVLSPTLWVFDAQRAAALAQWKLVPLGLIAGVCGSLLDSLLGAGLQFTGYDRASGALVGAPGPSVTRISGLQLPWLTDNTINLLAGSVTAALTALAALRMFG